MFHLLLLLLLVVVLVVIISGELSTERIELKCSLKIDSPSRYRCFAQIGCSAILLVVVVENRPRIPRFSV